MKTFNDINRTGNPQNPKNLLKILMKKMNFYCLATNRKDLLNVALTKP